MVPGVRRLVALMLALLATAVHSQPLVAGGGFDRPWQVGESTSTTRFAAAGRQGGAVAFWSDGQGIWARDLTEAGEARRLREIRGVRELAAAQVGGEPALAIGVRDLVTGRALHYLSWRGEERLLLEAAQTYRLAVVDAYGEPAMVLGRLEEGVHRLRLLHWDGSETIVRESDDASARPAAVLARDGLVHVAWLEGFTERGAALGPLAEWSVFYATVNGAGEASEAVRLGFARNLGLESRVTLADTPGGVRVLWPGEHGEVVTAAPGGEPVTVGVGAPVGVADGYAYWSEGTSIRRAPLEGGEPVNVAWSPVTVEQALLVTAEGNEYLVWYGPTRGLDYHVYASDDRTPLEPSWQDRVALRMGWSPWGFWEAFGGQLLGSLFAAVLVTMVLSPVVWLLALTALRFGAAQSTAWAGIAIGGGMLLAFFVAGKLWQALPEAALAPPLGSAGELAASVALAGGLTWLLWRRNDSEPLLGVMGSSLLCLFAALSLLTFLTFEEWSGYWQLLSG